MPSSGASSSPSTPPSLTALGLGLSICRAIVGTHGGTLEAVRHPEGGMTHVGNVPLPGGNGASPSANRWSPNTCESDDDTPPGPESPGSHTALFYEREPFCRSAIETFLADGARAGAPVALIARPRMFDAIVTRLASSDERSGRRHARTHHVRRRRGHARHGDGRSHARCRPTWKGRCARCSNGPLEFVKMARSGSSARWST